MSWSVDGQGAHEMGEWASQAEGTADTKAPGPESPACAGRRACSVSGAHGTKGRRLDVELEGGKGCTGRGCSQPGRLGV